MSLSAVLIGERRIVACSDSRNLREDGFARDDAHKLFQAGELSLCAIGGLLTLERCQPGVPPAPDKDISVLVRKLCLDETLKDRPQKLLSAIGYELKGPIAKLFAENPDQFRWYSGDNAGRLFSAMCVRRDRAGEIDLFMLEFLDRSINGVLCPPVLRRLTEGVRRPDGTAPEVGFMGPTSLDLTKITGRTFNPDISDEEVLLSADALFEAADLKDIVGGPIDVAAIDERGFSWLRRKPSELAEGGTLSLEALRSTGDTREP